MNHTTKPRSWVETGVLAAELTFTGTDLRAAAVPTPACLCAGEDRLLEAARRGWAVTVRYSILVGVTRWPALVGGTGAVTLAAGVTRARGWI
jgi:hypothetical protein